MGFYRKDLDEKKNIIVYLAFIRIKSNRWKSRILVD